MTFNSTTHTYSVKIGDVQLYNSYIFSEDQWRSTLQLIHIQWRSM